MLRYTVTPRCICPVLTSDRLFDVCYAPPVNFKRIFSILSSFQEQLVGLVLDRYGISALVSWTVAKRTLDNERTKKLFE